MSIEKRRLSESRRNLKEKMEDKVRVRFLKNNGEIYAAFVDLKQSDETILSYEHIGQHSEAHLIFVEESEDATLDEYRGLYIELVYQVGYELEVLNEDFDIEIFRSPDFSTNPKNDNSEKPKIYEVLICDDSGEKLGYKIDGVWTVLDQDALLNKLVEIIRQKYG